MFILRPGSIHDIALHFLRYNGRLVRIMYGMDASLHLGYMLILLMYFHRSLLYHERLYNNIIWNVWSMDSINNGCL